MHSSGIPNHFTVFYVVVRNTHKCHYTHDYYYYYYYMVIQTPYTYYGHLNKSCTQNTVLRTVGSIIKLFEYLSFLLIRYNYTGAAEASINK